MPNSKVLNESLRLPSAKILSQIAIDKKDQSLYYANSTTFDYRAELATHQHQQ
jgi:hypothetical protein